MILFQEVPGCATCVGYGEQVLSHPLLVDAIENLFIPVAVYNNIGGDDRKTLNSFNEPTWNNPVVRIVSVDRRELASRVDGDYTLRGITNAMVASLKAVGREIPEYLQILHDEVEVSFRPTERATFAMSCFWEGEAALGKIEGILSTIPGYLNGNEVVKVEYDPSVISYADLVKKAQTQQCALRVFTRTGKQHEVARTLVGNAAVTSEESVRPDSEPKYYLSKTLLRFVPMTPLQAAHVNAAVGDGDDPANFLSPRQIELFALIKAHPTARWKSFIGSTDITSAWDDVQTVAKSLAKM